MVGIGVNHPFHKDTYTHTPTRSPLCIYDTQLRVAAVGGGTGEALQAGGVTPEYVPSKVRALACVCLCVCVCVYLCMGDGG